MTTSNSNKTIDAVVFDADSTLFNSFELINEAYNHVAHVHGLEPPTPEQIREKLALSLPLAEMFRSFYPDQYVQALLHTNNTFTADAALKIAAFDGLHDLLEALRGQGMKMAILTGGGHKVTSWLEAHNIDQYFDGVVHSERTQHHKPHPGGFHLAMKECGTIAKNAVMVGDSLNDIKTGINAGAAATIGVTHGLGTKEDLKQAGADHIVSSLPEILPVVTRLRVTAH